jgi:hypothetical protein
LVLRILRFAVDEGAIEANPVRKVPSPRRRVDPDQVLDLTKRRALTPEEAGRLLSQFPISAHHSGDGRTYRDGGRRPPQAGAGGR